MSPANIKAIFIAALIALVWGGYGIARATYTAISWEKTEGTFVDLEQSTWSCGKGVQRCFMPIAGYHANNDYFTVVSDKKFNRDEPKFLIGNKVDVYYNPNHPAEAVLGGDYGPMNKGIFMFIFGSVVLLIFWFMRKKEQ